MDFNVVVNYLEKINSTTKNLEKVYLISKLLKNSDEDLEYLILFLQGLVFKETEQKDLGISARLLIKTFSKLTGISEDRIEALWKDKGDLGDVIYELMNKIKQKSLILEKRLLTLKEIYSIFKKIAAEEGEKSIIKKIAYLNEIYYKCSPLEAKYFTRLILGQLRAGIATGLLIDAIAFAYLPKDINSVKKCEDCDEVVFDYDYCVNCKSKSLFSLKIEVPKISDFNIDNLDQNFFNLDYVDDDLKILKDIVEEKYNYCNDLSYVVLALKDSRNDPSLFNKINITLFTPVRSMLFVKVNSSKEALEVVGIPAAVEYKYDGFRVQAHVKQENDSTKVKLYTRNLEEVTEKFPEIVEELKLLNRNIILDGEVVAYENEKPLPFQKISQRIMRKYNIENYKSLLSVKYHVFDILYLDDKVLVKEPFSKRRETLIDVMKKIKSDKLLVADQIIVTNPDQINEFFDKAIQQGHEGVMVKSLNAIYKPGKRVGYGVKLKAVLEPLDLVITQAEYGEGKRSKWLSSYYVSCIHNGEFLEIGKVSSGLKEKAEEGITYEEMTNLLKPLIINEEGKKVKLVPKIVVSVAYEEIQKSNEYESGFALRFPRILMLREKPINECSTLDDVISIYNKQRARNQ
ncbi:MAG: ATP-dependent DNA ligase [Candidatus Woesearchaeota archaeon]